MKNHSFEKTILIAISILTIVRYFFALVSFWAGELDIVIFILFNVVLLLSITTLLMINRIRSVRFVGILWTLIFVVLSSVAFIMMNGLQGVEENGLIGCMMLVAMLNSGRVLRVLIGMVVVIQLMLVVLLEYHSDFFSSINFLVGDNYQFQLLIVYITTVLLFFSQQYLKQKGYQISKKKNLHMVMSEIHDGNLTMEKQEVELRKINERLEKGVKERSHELRENNKALNSYLNVSNSEIAPAVKDLVSYIEESDFSNDLNDMLLESGKKLNEAFMSIEQESKKRNDS
ncbi:MAG: hypothetical protein OCD76_11225 [Reichenbachiella sp.]